MKILWIIDVPDWAYDINAKSISSKLNNHSHNFIYGNKTSNVDISQYDKVIIMFPPNISICSHIDNYSKIVFTLNSHRVLGDINVDILKKIGSIVCANKSLYDYAIKYNKNSFFIPEGLDLNYFKCNNKQLDKFVIGFSGNIKASSSHKGYPIYKKVVDNLTSIDKSISSLCVGIGSTFVKRENIVNEFYNKISCLVLLSINEGCSSVIMEALACGVPVICTKVGYHGDVLENNKNVIFINRDEKELTNAINLLYTNQYVYNEIKKNGIDFASRYHNIDNISKEFELAITNNH